MFVPLYFSLLFSIFGWVSLHFMWEENVSSDLEHPVFKYSSFKKRKTTINDEFNTTQKKDNSSLDLKTVIIKNENDVNFNNNDDEIDFLKMPTKRLSVNENEFSIGNRNLSLITINQTQNKMKDIYKNFKDCFSEFKKENVLYLGITEAIVQSSFSIFIFAWTPILLKLSPLGELNYGTAFICFVLSLICGAIIYDILLIKLKYNYFKVLFGSLILQFFCFTFILVSRSFYLCLLVFAVINGNLGFVSPLLSIIKSNIIVEKYRSQIMTIFRVPLYLISMILLLINYYYGPYKVRLNLILDYSSFIVDSNWISYFLLFINE